MCPSHCEGYQSCQLLNKPSAPYLAVPEATRALYTWQFYICILSQEPSSLMYITGRVWQVSRTSVSKLSE
jgi:hypothetical protein